MAQHAGEAVRRGGVGQRVDQCLARRLRRAIDQPHLPAGGERDFERRGARRARVDVARQHDAQQARVVVAAFGVAADPVQVFDQTRRQEIVAAHDVGGAQFAPAQRVDRRFAVGEHPGVLAAAAALHRDDARRRLGGDA